MSTELSPICVSYETAKAEFALYLNLYIRNCFGRYAKYQTVVNVERNQLQNIELAKQNDIPEVTSFKARQDRSVSACTTSGYTPASLHITLHFLPFHSITLHYLLTYLLTHLLTYSLTHLLTPWSTVLLEKLTGSQPVKKVPSFYGTRRFITAFTSAQKLSFS